MIILLIKFANKYVESTNKLLSNPHLNIDKIQFKTGDVLLFQNMDCRIKWILPHILYNIIFGVSVTHMGIVIMINNVPHVFECGMDRRISLYDLLSKEYIKTTDGSTLTPLKENLNSYNGYVFHHSVNDGNPHMNDRNYSLNDFYEFILNLKQKERKVTARRLFSVLFKFGGCAHEENTTNCIEVCTELLKYMNIIDKNECTYKYDFCDITQLLHKKYNDPIVVINNYLL